MAFGVTVDNNNVSGQQVEEAGKYNVRILDSSEAKQTSTGKDMAVMNYEVTDGPYAGGQIRYDNIVWDETDEDSRKRSERNFNTMLVAAGVPEGTRVDSIQSFVKGMAGKELSVTVDWNEFNGKVNLNVKRREPKLANGSEPNGITRDMYSAEKGISQSNVSRQNQQDQQGASNPFQGQQGVDISDDDLPF
ncbi:DUF669 domain-containing protein [Fructobacillus papyrifericola]|uniref:DUF669 domain-containing protein n=1 Tax=Fructobacillus papyrifericola TaxID=2713172 RepID=A0ABS5QUE1_9LACO|nr:DUF669 domain-containing protein [Fructobacillus papyrifericola]MBS9336437.1 DUF669 domain-containing protein [Fructobacillus papyrifericola]